MNRFAIDIREHVNKNGNAKAAYRTRLDAVLAAAQHWPGKPSQHVYQCSWCNRFHLSHHKKAARKPRSRGRSRGRS